MGYIPTKEFRHELYKKALEAYLNEDLFRFGLCNAIEQAYHFLKYGHFIKKYDPWEQRTWPLMYDHPECYSEIMKHDPKNERAYWFPLENIQIRIDILNQAIEETKP